MRTYIYVDGFNLYYRALKQTPFKWLDLSGLFRDVLKPHHDILKIRRSFVSRPWRWGRELDGA